MTIKQAAKKWGCTGWTVTQYCRSGKIPGANKQRIGCNTYWIIPDDATQPADARFEGRAELPGISSCNPCDPTGFDPAEYVWRFQKTGTIGQLAKKLGVSGRRVTELFDEAFERYKGGTDDGTIQTP